MRKRSIKGRRDDYEIGKNRPPIETRWKPGQSGNPKGRRKGARSRVSIFNDALNQTLTTQEGKARKITTREAIVWSMIIQALKRNIKAIEFIIEKEPEIAQQAADAKRAHVSPEEAIKAWQHFMRTDEI